MLGRLHYGRCVQKKNVMRCKGGALVMVVCKVQLDDASRKNIYKAV